MAHEYGSFVVLWPQMLGGFICPVEENTHPSIPARVLLFLLALPGPLQRFRWREYAFKCHSIKIGNLRRALHRIY